MPTREGARLGVWIVGACGGVGSTVALGLAALRKKLVGTGGLVAELPPFAPLSLTPVKDLVFGGHDIRPESLLEAVEATNRRARLFSEGLVATCRPALRTMQHDVRPGCVLGISRAVRAFAQESFAPADPSPAAAIERLSDDLVRFRKVHRLDHVVVVHCASAEPVPDKQAGFENRRSLERLLARRGGTSVPPSALYALSAIEAGCPYINFTSGVGINLPAIRDRADRRGIAYMGNDGKTGETLVKAALAPLFTSRNLRVRSWVGYNVLGNRDGAVLADGPTRAGKLRTKDRTLSAILGPSATTRVSIDYVPSLDDWKVAWDFVDFQGFLDTPMHFQFIWQGSDSVLAAPLVIDLARFAGHAAAAGHSGPMTHLAFFFKDPMAVGELDLHAQWLRLLGYAAGQSTAGRVERRMLRKAPTRPTAAPTKSRRARGAGS